MAFQPLVMTWPVGRVNVTAQPLIALALVLVTVRLAVKPVFHVFMS